MHASETGTLEELDHMRLWKEYSYKELKQLWQMTECEGSTNGDTLSWSYWLHLGGVHDDGLQQLQRGGLHASLV
jgi:hypothetical protein